MPPRAPAIAIGPSTSASASSTNSTSSGSRKHRFGQLLYQYSTGSLQFGQVAVGDSAGPLLLEVFNNHPKKAATLEAFSVASPFYVAGVTPPVRLASRSGVTLEVSFRPELAGVFSADLLLTVDTRVTVVALSGEGVSAAPPPADPCDGVTCSGHGTVDGVTECAYTVAGLSSGTWFFAVTAYSSSGVESGFSNEVFKSIATGGSSFAAAVNFQPASAAVPSGYLVDSGLAFDGTRGFGWVSSPRSMGTGAPSRPRFSVPQEDRPAPAAPQTTQTV